MKMIMNRKLGRCAVTALAVTAIAGAMPMASMAAPKNKPGDANVIVDPPTPEINKDMSPEFAYTPEKWASMRDNVLDFGEITDLVHEYNPTVRSNRSTYKDQKSKNLNDAYDDYMDDIDTIWNAADSDDDVAWASARFQTGIMQRTADNNYQDADMEKIQYDQTEANLAYQAQQMMVTYEQSKYNMEDLQSTRNLLQAQYEATVAKQANGMATSTDVLTALKSVQDQDSSILAAQKSADNVHRGLCLMLGWQVDGQPDIQPVPEPDQERISSLNPDADLETAVANNYDVRYYEKKAGNLSSQYAIDANVSDIQNAKDNAAKALKTQYNTVITGRDALNASTAALQVAAVNLNTAQAKKAVGDMTDLDYQDVQNKYTTAVNDVHTKKLQLLMDLEAYNWNVKGLVSSN